MSHAGRHPFHASLLMVVLVCSVAGCTTLEDIVRSDTRVDYKKGYDFDHIERLAIAPASPSDDRPAVLDDEQTERVNLALRRALEKQGMQVVEEPGKADAIVDWHVVLEERSNVRSYNAQSYYQCWRCGPAISDKNVSTYTMGTFIIDIVDPELSKSIWRGVVNGRLNDLSDMDLQQEQADAAANEILSKFPPKNFLDVLY